MIGPQSGEVVQAAGAPPGGYGPPPGGGSYGPPGGGGYGPPPPPGGGGYGPPPGGGGYGPPPGGGGYGSVPPPGAGQTQLGPGGPPVQATVVGSPLGMTAAAPKKSGAGGKIVIALLALLAIGGGAFAAYWFWMRSTGPELAKYLPADTQVYVEVPNITKAVVAAIGMDPVAIKELEPEERKNDLVEAFESSFDMKKDDAESLVKGIDAVAFAGRELGKSDDKSEAAIIIRFSDKGAVEALLESKRFDKDGSVGKGTAYKLTRVEPKDPDKEEKLSAFEKFLNQLGDSKDKDKEDDGDKKKKDKKLIVWFDSQKLLVAGDEAMIEEIGKVIEGDKDNLAKHNETFAKANWPAGSSLLIFADPAAFPKDVKKEFFNDVGPLTGSMRFTDPGVIVSAHLEMAGKKVSKKELLPEEASLTLFEKLPSSTVAYIAFSTKFGVDGKEMEKAIKKSYSDVDESGGEQIEKMLDGMKDQLGFGLDTVFDAMGDEAIIAVTADDKLAGLAFEKDKQAFEHGSVITIFALDKTDGKENADKIIKKLKSTIEDKAKDEIAIKKIDGGFVASPGDRAKKAMGDVDASFSISVEEDKYLVVIVGTKKRIDEANEALGGTETLKGDNAHKKALAAFEGKPLAVLWVDAGRIAKALLKESKEVKSSLKDAGFPVDALILEGDDRVTAGYAVRAAWKDDILMLDIDTLNLPIFAGVGAAAAFAPRKKKEDNKE